MCLGASSFILSSRPLSVRGSCIGRSDMGKPLIGPDWTDVEMLMRAMSSLHSASVGLTFLPDGIGATGGLAVAANCIFDVLPGSSIDPCVNVIKRWPCASHASLEGHCFALLHELDFQVGKMYKNEVLWS